MDIIGNEKTKAELVQHHSGDAPEIYGHGPFHDLIKNTDRLALLSRFEGLRTSMDLGPDVVVRVDGQYNDKGVIGANRYGDFIIEHVTVGGAIIPSALSFLDGVRDYDSGRFLSEVA